MRLRRGLAFVVAALVTVGPAQAADPQEVTERVARQVMSPFCDGLTLHDCPSQQSVELRAEVLAMAKRGMSANAIVDELVARYGERIRGVPEPQGTDLLVWVLPGLAVVAALAAATILARRFSARQPDQSRLPPTAEEQARLDAEMNMFRSET
jgi:cytochrome c-type biogenesis protein CcmH